MNIYFARNRRQLALLVLAALLAALPVTGATDDHVLLKRLTYASSPERRSAKPELSADGRVVVFTSESDYFGEGIEDGDYNIWLLDIETEMLMRITDPLQPGRISDDSTVSADGVLVAFRSDGDFLNEGIMDGSDQIWLYTSDDGSLVRVSAPMMEGRCSYEPEISDDGSTIAFISDCDFLSEGIPDEHYNLWLYDIKSQALTRATPSVDNERLVRQPSLNTDGTQVVFHSDADFLGEGIQEDQYEIWHYDVPSAQLTRITRSPLEDRSSTAAYISGDGMRIAFQSDVDFHDEGILLGQTEVWFYELEQRALRRVTHASGEGRDSFIKGISANGRLVLLDGDSDFNGEGLADNRFEIWLYSVDEEGMRRLSLASDENRDSVWGTLSDAGAVVFASDSDMLGEGIEDSQSELWLWQGDE